MAFLITAMCRDGAALRFDVLRNSSNACEGTEIENFSDLRNQRIGKEG